MAIKRPISLDYSAFYRAFLLILKTNPEEFAQKQKPQGKCTCGFQTRLSQSTQTHTSSSFYKNYLRLIK